MITELIKYKDFYLSIEDFLRCIKWYGIVDVMMMYREL